MNNILILVLLVTTQVLGDIWLSQGMKMFGEVKSFSLSVGGELIVYVLANPWIWLGVVSLILALLLYLTAISRLDLSYVLPVRSLGYVLNAILAWSILDEHISYLRWLSTLTIAVGVFIITWSESKKLSKTNNLSKFLEQKRKANWWKLKRPINFSLFLFPGTLISKTWLGLLTLVFADSAGDIFMAKGMKQIGKVSLLSRSKMLKSFKGILTNPFIGVGIACYGLSFLAFICLLTWADVSFIRPATAMGYVFSILGAHYILKEKMTLGRLTGIAVIGMGVGIISLTG